MSNKIHSITIGRSMMAMPHGMHTNTRVSIHRGDTCVGYDTNPLSKRGNISNASVIRAKRAQMAILERAAQHAVVTEAAL